MSSPAEHETVFLAIAEHAAAFARFELATGRCDEVAAKRAGRLVTEEDQAEYDAANEAEEATFATLLSSIPETIVQLRRKLLYLRMHASTGNALDRDEVDALIASLIAFSPFNPWADA